MKVDRVLVPLDGSPLAEMAIPKALELLSDRPGSTLILLRAVEATTLPGSVGAHHDHINSPNTCSLHDGLDGAAVPHRPYNPRYASLAKPGRHAHEIRFGLVHNSDLRLSRIASR